MGIHSKMASAVRLSRVSQRIQVYPILRYCTAGSASTGSTSTADKQPTPETQTTSDNSSYKAQQYYGYNEMSFFDLDVEMMKHRIKQPSSYDKLVPQKS